MVIEFHVHAFPDELASRAIPTLSEKGGITAYSDDIYKKILGENARKLLF